MTVSHILFILLLCVLTGSYTWGMRGTIVGGERGAMLPGAALALVLLFAGGSVPVASAFPLAATVGAAGMFFGGSQTYGETIGLTHEEDGKTRRHARFGLALKGAGWFGVFGGVLGFGFGTMAGRYALWETILFVAVLPVVRILGVLLFNSPYKPKEKKLPKIYFSQGRHEVWGGVILVFLYVVVFCACKREWFSVLLAVFGLIFGALGFFAGNMLQTFADRNLSQTWISGWKAMECVFGAIGALGIGLCWCMFYAPFVSRYTFEITAHSGAWTPLSEKAYTLLAFIWLVLLALFIARYWVRQPKKKKSSKFSRLLYDAEDFLIWPVFCLLPLLWAAFGDMFFARIFSCFGIFYLLPDKIVFGGKSRYEKMPLASVLHGVLIIGCAVLLIVHLFVQFEPSAYALWLIYLLAYLLVMYWIKLSPLLIPDKIRKHGSLIKAMSSLGVEPSWLIYAGLCVVTLLILGKPYFTL